MGKVGKLQVALDQPYYLAGQTVTGTVFLELKEEIEVDKIYIKASGKEKVEWSEHWKEPRYHEVDGERQIEGYDEKEKEYDEKEAFFKKKIMLVPEEEDEHELKPGKYAFPFQFDLPKQGKKGSALAGSIQMKTEHAGWHWHGARGATKDMKVKVQYSIKAVVDVDDSKDLEKKVDFTVYPQAPEEIPQPRDEREASVMFLCCINRGSLKMAASLEKNVYRPGEKAKALLTVENNSSLEVTAMVELNRRMTLKADGHRISNNHEIHIGRFDTIQPDETKTVEMEFTVPSTLPTTHGRGVKCDYVLDIVSELQCAPDIELHFPIVIFQTPVEPKKWLESIPDPSAYIAIATPCKVEDMPLKEGYTLAAA